jgi:dipeptidyl aminopeptidase/acylaminoacyl peptidase
MGVSGPSDPTLEALSPIRHVEQVSGPVLLVHGRDDTVVPYEQSAVMAVALERAGKTVELVALDEEDHWLSRGASRLRMLEHVLAFLAVHNPSE